MEKTSEKTKRRILFIMYVGLAFYAGMKFTKPEVKTVVKTVVKKDVALQIMFNACNRAQKECVEKYDILVDEANNKIKNLEAQISTCEERYYTDTPNEYPKKNLEPELVEEKEPELEVQND